MREGQGGKQLRLGCPAGRAAEHVGQPRVQVQDLKHFPRREGLGDMGAGRVQVSPLTIRSRQGGGPNLAPPAVPFMPFDLGRPPHSRQQKDSPPPLTNNTVRASLSQCRWLVGGEWRRLGSRRSFPPHSERLGAPYGKGFEDVVHGCARSAGLQGEALGSCRQPRARRNVAIDGRSWHCGPTGTPTSHMSVARAVTGSRCG